ncbi:MAG: hypothetical protein ACQESF_01315 [Nanobdellota archaeon]
MYLDYKKLIKKGTKTLLLGLSREIEGYSKEINAEIEVLHLDKDKCVSRFFDLAKKYSSRFDLVIDLGFSQYIYKDKLADFYMYIARVLKYEGFLHSMVLSSDSPDCKMRCPIRHWTKIENNYVRFIPSEELKEFIRANFKIISLDKHKIDDKVFFEINAINDIKKF